MGEAKRKKQEWSAFCQSLSSSDRIAADVAQSTYQRFVVPAGAMGMCYRVAFFLMAYLQEEHNIESNAIVGYAHDRTSPVMASHAWLEIGGKKTDLSMAFTEHPDVQLPGEVLIFDFVYKSGRRYGYYRERDEAALNVIKELSDHPQYGNVVQQKEAEHASMLELSQSPARIRQYLDAAPDGVTYDEIARLIRA